MMTHVFTADPETSAFLNDFWPRQLAAERAIHDGDPEPRKALWSHRDPVTLLGAYMDRREDGEWRIVHRHADEPPVT